MDRVVIAYAIHSDDAISVAVCALECEVEALQCFVFELQSKIEREVRALADHRFGDLDAIDVQRRDIDVKACAARRAWRCERRLAVNDDAGGVHGAEPHRAAENVLRAPCQRNIVGFDPNAVFIGDSDARGAEIAEPAASDILDFKVAEPPNTRAVGKVIDHHGCGRPDTDRCAGQQDRSARGAEDQSVTAALWRWRRGGVFAQNAWPKLI